MPKVYPFTAIQYNQGTGDVSALVAPPYDVIGESEKRALLAKSPDNIVAIDLPHTPAKELGPPEAYAGAAERLSTAVASGVLSRRERPAMFVYRQSFNFLGEHFQRTGMACALETVPLGPRDGGGVLPHEQTFSGPKEDRLALMKATKSQLSPIFGLHADDSGRATEIVRGVAASRAADMTAELGDGVTHEVWTVEDEATIRAYDDALAGEDVFVADGHHRYNTAVNYLKHLEETEGKIGPDHAARRCMFVLVGMSDPGLAIGPTHRVLGGMSGYSIEAFIEAAGDVLDVKEIGEDPSGIERAMEATGSANVFGLIDFATGRCFTATLKKADPLAESFADKPEAWRKLDVALIQHVIVERVCEPKLNEGKPVRWAFPHSVEEVLEIGRGAETGAGGGSGFAQFAVIVRPTPLEAVREISRANELMPQKSTFFYPKLATGLFVKPLA
jgi:uncharacterized protein (DUF1015 family)